jgi:para-nitrobenzyl esterase
MPKKVFYILFFFLLFSFEISAQEIDGYVTTSSGKVKGYLNNKVINYDDIPYAQPPVGDLRWKAPREF